MIGIDFIKFINIASDKTSTIGFFCNRFESKRIICCPKCTSKNYYVMAKGYLRCVDCKSDYNPFKDTWLNVVKIDHVKWLSLIKLFDLGISARQAAREVSVSYPTALNAFDSIRYAILYSLAKTDDILKGEIEADEAYFGGKRKGNRGRGAKNKTIVFGILERKGKVSVDIVSDVSAKTLLGQTVKKVRKGSIVYTDKWRGYDSLMFSGYKHMAIDHQKRFANGKVYINGIEGFWSFAKERIAKHHGISSGKFLLYIKEMEWRYNNRNVDTFSLLVDYILGEDN